MGTIRGVFVLEKRTVHLEMRSRDDSGLMVANTLYDWLRKALVKFRPIPRFDPASRISNCWFSRSICIRSGDVVTNNQDVFGRHDLFYSKMLE